jgi:hypothetical protein
MEATETSEGIARRQIAHDKGEKRDPDHHKDQADKPLDKKLHHAKSSLPGGETPSISDDSVNSQLQGG